MKIYLVGGAVRDRLLGLEVRERDWVVVGSSPEEMARLGYRPVGRGFPVFLHPQTGEEYALARTERKTAPGYRGFTFHAAPDVTLEQDLARRDLTINAIAEDADGTLIDPFGGREDLQLGRLRHVSDAFAEDPVRILRCARFAARFAPYGFRVAHATQRLMRAMVEAGEVDALVPERVWAEFERALGERTPGRFVEVLQRCGALARLAPELDALFGGSTGGHGAAEPPAVLADLQRAAGNDADPAVRFALLLQAVGDRERVDALCRRLHVPNRFRELALLATERLGECRAARADRPGEIVALLEACDALRRPERLAELLEVVAATGSPAPESLLLRALEAMRGVDARTLAAEGLRGPAIGDELRRRRIAAVSRLGDEPTSGT